MVTVELYTHAFFSATPEKEVLITWAKKDDASAKETKKNNAATIPLPIIPSKSKSKPSKSKSSSFFTGQNHTASNCRKFYQSKNNSIGSSTRKEENQPCQRNK